MLCVCSYGTNKKNIHYEEVIDTNMTSLEEMKRKEKKGQKNK